MAIERGRAYGTVAPLPDGAPVVDSDRALRELVLRRREEGRPLPVVGLLGGDLCRTLGGTGDRSRLTGPEAMTLPVDLAVVTLDGRVTAMVAHLLVGRLFAGGTAVMQAQWLGDLDLGPRSHPADGMLDVTSGSVPIGQRRTARRRARSGTHLPHPGLRHERRREVVLESERAQRVVIDGVYEGRHRHIVVELFDEALMVVV